MIRGCARRHRQRGAAMVFAAIWLVAALACIGLAVDLGNLYLQQRALQRAANMAAMDAAYVASGCVGELADRATAARREVLASLSRNGASPDWASDGDAVLLGRRDSVDGVFRFVQTSPRRASAVQVTLRRPFPQRIVPLFGAEPEGRMMAVAAAEALPAATVHVGSVFASAAPEVGNTLLCELAGCSGAPLAVDALGYQSLFAAELRLSQLVPVPGDADSIPEFLDTEITVEGLLGLVADALLEAGNLAAGTAAQAIADAFDGAGTVLPAEIFDVVDDFEQPLQDAVVSAGQIVAGAAEAVRDGNAITAAIDELGLLPMLGPGTATVRFLGGETTMVGPPGFDETGQPFTEASNARMVVQLDYQAPPVAGANLRVALLAEVAPSRARLESLSCARRGQPGALATVAARSGLSRIGVGQWRDAGGGVMVAEPVTLLELEVLGQPIRITGFGMAELGAGDWRTLRFGDFGYEFRQRIGVPPSEAVRTLLNSLTGNLRIDVEGVPAGPLGDAVRAALAPVLAQVADAVTGQLAAAEPALLSLAGANLGGADVWVTGNAELVSARLFLR